MTEYELTTLTPSRTEQLRFKGRIIAETEWTTNRGEWMQFTIWETEGGAYIATREGSIPNSERTDLGACVVEPIEDRQAMHIAVLRFFDGHDRARSMIRKQLKWNLIREVA